MMDKDGIILMFAHNNKFYSLFCSFFIKLTTSQATNLLFLRDKLPASVSSNRARKNDASNPEEKTKTTSALDRR